MRIAFVTEAWSPYVDGMVTRLEHTARELRRAGHEILVIAPTTGTGVPGVAERRSRSVRLGFLYGGRPWGVPDPAIGAWLSGFAPDVVHVVNPIFMGAAAVRSTAGRFPVVASYHTDVLAYAAHYRLGWLRPVIRTVMQKTYRRAQVRLATSEVGRAQLGVLGISGVELWPRGVDHGLFRPGRDRTRLRHRLGPDARLPVALYVGRLAAEKGCAGLLPLATASPPVQVAFVGDGPQRDHLHRLFHGARATFTGVLRGEDLADAYAAADALVFPSTTDTLGLVLLEAMATGLPVVAADSPTARSTLHGYPAAFFVPPDAEGTAWNHTVHAATRLTGEAGREPAPAFPPAAADWAQATAALLGSYERAIRGGGTPSGEVA